MSITELERRVNELRKEADLCGACDGNGSWREYGCKIMCACCEGIREELEPLEDQLAIERNAELDRNGPPEPAWTSEPPTVDGWYWCRNTHSDVHPFIVERSGSHFGMCGAGRMRKAEEMEPYSFEFWPIRLEPPPSQITPPISDKGDPAQ